MAQYSKRMVELMEEILHRLDTLTQAGVDIDIQSLGIEVPQEPHIKEFKSGWRPKDHYILDDTGRSLLRAAREYIREHKKVPSVSTLCSIVGIKQHHFTNRFQRMENFLYYLTKAN